MSGWERSGPWFCSGCFGDTPRGAANRCWPGSRWLSSCSARSSRPLAMILLAPPALIRIMPLQPMRYLHLEFIFLVLIAGCLYRAAFSGRTVWRWALFLAVANGGMFISQRVLFPATEHLELPGRASANPWLQAFDMGPAEHAFERLLCPRSRLSGCTRRGLPQFPGPGRAQPVGRRAQGRGCGHPGSGACARWASEVDAQDGWGGLQLADFERLKGRYGVNWVLVSYPAPARLTCIWHNAQLAVCQIPGAGPAPTL